MRHAYDEQQVVELDQAIGSYLESFRAVPEYKMLWKPKHHFLTHVPIDIMFAACSLRAVLAPPPSARTRAGALDRRAATGALLLKDSTRSPRELLKQVAT